MNLPFRTCGKCNAGRRRCQSPPDYTDTAFNEDACTSGIKLANAGYLRVTVSETDVRVKGRAFAAEEDPRVKPGAPAAVEYVRSFLPADETSGHRNGEPAYAYANNQRTKEGRIKRIF